jgi:hypothetical protein
MRMILAGARAQEKRRAEARLLHGPKRGYLLRFCFFSSSVSEPFVAADPLVELVPEAVVDCEALPLADWSPVVVVAVWPEVWSPVVAFEVVLTDWSPVVVALSMVRLERPRRSMFGLKVEVDPVTAVLVSVEDPVMDELCEVEEPVTEGLAVALPEAFTPVVALWFVDALWLAEADGVLVAAAALVPLLALACESGMQSMWTGLEERSPAIPVSLSASLPAFGWFSSLQSGLAVVPLVEAVGLAVDDLALSVNWAHAGAVPSSAARVMVLR